MTVETYEKNKKEIHKFGSRFVLTKDKDKEAEKKLLSFGMTPYNFLSLFKGEIEIDGK